VALYLAVCLGVGLWALRRTQSTRDFFMAGRQLGVLITGCVLISAWALPPGGRPLPTLLQSRLMPVEHRAAEIVQ